MNAGARAGGEQLQQGRDLAGLDRLLPAGVSGGPGTRKRVIGAAVPPRIARPARSARASRVSGGAGAPKSRSSSAGSGGTPTAAHACRMLALASRRGAYSALTRAALGGPLPYADGRFAAFFSTGVFTEGHAPASGLDELVRATRRGGHAVFTVRDIVLERDGFRARFAELERAGRWRPVEESPPFRAFAIAEPDVLVQAFVFEVS